MNHLGQRVGWGVGVLAVAAGLLVGAPSEVVAPAMAAGCSASPASVMRPNSNRAFGVGNANCGGSSACVTTTLYRASREISSGRRCGRGNVQVSTEWVNAYPRDDLSALVTVVPTA